MIQIAAVLALSIYGAAAGPRCPGRSGGEYVSMALDGDCNGAFEVNPSMSVLLGCDIVMNDGAKNETPTLKPLNFRCSDDSGAERFIQLRRRITSALEDGTGKASMFASDTDTIEGNNFEDPASVSTSCDKDGIVRCITSPCSVLSISYFQDPRSKYNVDKHGSLLSPDSSSSASRNFEEDGNVTAVYGYSQCDPMAGTRLMEYSGSISDFKQVGVAVDYTGPAKAAMQRLAAEIRSDTSAFGSEAGRELWPDTIPVPPVFTINEKETNPLYMYCENGNINATNKECAGMRRYLDPDNNAKVLPPPMDWQCSQASSPPPVVWVLPDAQTGGFRLSTTASPADVKAALEKAGRRRLDTLLAGSGYSEDKAGTLRENFYYTYETQTNLPSGAHPRKVRCQGSSPSNPHDPTKTGQDQNGYIELSNCFVDAESHHRFFFGSMPHAYNTDYTPILVYPQLPGEKEGESVPGAFSTFPQIIGYVFTPQVLNILVEDIYESDGGAAKRAARVEAAINGLVAGSSVYSYDPQSDPTDGLVYTPDTCHIFSDDTPVGGGCAWLPRHVPPAICLDARAAQPQDTFIPASSSRMTRYGRLYGLLEFDSYACTNFHATLETGEYNDADSSMVLQHRGPIECLRARTNDAMNILANDIYDRGSSGDQRTDAYSTLQNDFRTMGNFAFRMSEPVKDDIRYSMDGSGYSPYAIIATASKDLLRVASNTRLSTATSSIGGAFAPPDKIDPQEHEHFVSRHCSGTYKQAGGMPFRFEEGKGGYNGDWWSTSGNSTRGYCDWSALLTDTSAASTARKNPKLWLSQGKNRYIPTLTGVDTWAQFERKMCPLSSCQDSKYGEAVVDDRGFIYPWATISNDLHHSTTYFETSCSCCTYSGARMYWYEKWFFGRGTRGSVDFSGTKKYDCMPTADDDDDDQARSMPEFRKHQLDFVPDYIREVIKDWGEGSPANDEKTDFACNCADQWNGRYATGMVFTDLFYDDITDPGQQDQPNVPFAHFQANSKTRMSRGGNIGAWPNEYPGRLAQNNAYPEDGSVVGVRWHYNYSAFYPGFSFAASSRLDGTLRGEGYGTGTRDFKTVSVTLCSNSDDSCTPIEDMGIDPDVLLGEGGSNTNFLGKLLFTRQALRQSHAYRTNLVVNTKLQQTFPELHPYDGYSFARARAWTSSVTPGEACSCRNRVPEYRCFDSLLSQEDPPDILGDTVANLRTFISQNFTSIENTTAYADDVLSSLVLATCGFFWKGDNNKLVFGLPMYGKTDSKFYVYQHNVFNGDYYTSQTLSGVMAENTSGTQSRRAISSMLFTDPIDQATLVNYNEGGGVWEFPSTCLKWPYGHAHIQSFSEEDAQKLVSNTKTEQKAIPGSNNRVVATRVFGSEAQLGYCDKPGFSTGGNGPRETAFAHCTGDPNTPEQRQAFCSSNKHASDRFGGLRISNPDPARMCNDAVCLFVPGYTGVATLRDFFMDSRLDLANKSVLVAPFTAETVQYGMFFDFIVNDRFGIDTEDNGVSFTDKRAFAMLAAMPPNFSVDDVKEATRAFVRIMCPEGRGGLCRKNVVPGDGATTSTIQTGVLSEEVLPPMNVTDVQISQEGVSVESATDYMWFKGTPKHAKTHTRFNVGARNVRIGAMVADQTGCSEGFRCAAVVFSGTDVSGSGTEGVQAENTDVAVMALGLDTAAFGVAGRDLLADGLEVGVVVSPGQSYAFAAAAASGNMSVDCGAGPDRCAAIIQPMRQDSMAVTSPDDKFSLFNLSEATGVFGEAEERRIFARPPDQTTTLLVIFITLLVSSIITLAIHIALFIENRAVCNWLVERAVRGKNLERQQSPEAAYPWCVRWSPTAKKYIVYASNGSGQKLAPLDPLTTVITRVVTGIDGGCKPYTRHIGLVEYAKECIA